VSEEIAAEMWAHPRCQSQDISRDVRGLTLQGRVGILGVHARNKKVEEGLDYHKVARATAGFTGAELMNLMNTAAIVAVRRGAKIITEADVFQVDSTCTPCSCMLPDAPSTGCCILIRP
jgi:SpoVK/Ycf46/Vps4 family AAA+-type ATPase